VKVWQLTSSCLSVRVSLRPHGTTQFTVHGFSWNLVFERFFKNMSRKFKFHKSQTRTASTLREDRWTVLVISSCMKMRNVSDKGFRNSNKLIQLNTTVHYAEGGQGWLRVSASIWGHLQAIRCRAIDQVFTYEMLACYGIPNSFTELLKYINPQNQFTVRRAKCRVLKGAEYGSSGREV
jgi:hypothetical protein